MKRSSFSQPRTSFTSNESDTNSETSMRRRFSALPRSKSSGRDPRLTDLMNAYQGRADQPGLVTDDTTSRDSGHYSVGTPELGWRGITRGHSFPQSADTVSLYSGQNGTDHSRRYGHVTSNLDTRSSHNLDSHLLNWAPIAEGEKPKMSGKRKYSTFDEAISDDDDEVMAKRPRTPENYDQVDTASESYKVINILKKILRICLKLFLLIILVVTCLLCYATYKNYQCSHNQSQAIDTQLIKRELSYNLFGQHLAANEIVSSMTSFTQSHSSPLLILLLCGWLGSGKTHTASLLSSLLPVQANTHFITCSLPHTLHGISTKIVRSCGYSLLVLDDLDSADEDTLDMIEKLIISIHNEPDSKSNGTIIVATTSAGGLRVNKLLLEMFKNSVTSRRDSLTIENVLSVLDADMVTLTIPLHKTLTDHNIPVRLVPFLPLTREHLRMCAFRLAMGQGITISDMQVNKILDQVHYFSKELPIFSKTGCKQISAKIDLLMGADLDL